MHPQDVICNEAVASLVDIVCDDEEQVETGEKGVWKCDVLMWVLVDVVLKRSIRQ